MGSLWLRLLWLGGGSHVWYRRGPAAIGKWIIVLDFLNPSLKITEDYTSLVLLQASHVSICAFQNNCQIYLETSVSHTDWINVPNLYCHQNEHTKQLFYGNEWVPQDHSYQKKRSYANFLPETCSCHDIGRRSQAEIIVLTKMARTFDSRKQASIFAEGHTRVWAGLHRVLGKGWDALAQSKSCWDWAEIDGYRDVRQVVTPEVHGPQRYTTDMV